MLGYLYQSAIRHQSAEFDDAWGARQGHLASSVYWPWVTAYLELLFETILRDVIG